jgi:hypothetical protein
MSKEKEQQGSQSAPKKTRRSVLSVEGETYKLSLLVESGRWQELDRFQKREINQAANNLDNLLFSMLEGYPDA